MATMDPTSPIIHIVTFQFETDATPEEMKKVRIPGPRSTFTALTAPVLTHFLLSSGL